MQVIALKMRSSAKQGEQLPSCEAELDYASMLNRVLPSDIKVSGWAPVTEDFSAR